MLAVQTLVWAQVGDALRPLIAFDFIRVRVAWKDGWSLKFLLK
jgi:hypothetical protein